MSEIGSAIWFEELREAFRPDYERGQLVLIKNKQRPDLIGKEAGFIDNCGYVRVAFQGRKFLRSHILFALLHGRMPQEKLDHINRNRTDDRPDNLREVGHHQNMWNRTPKRRDLPMGVTAKDGRFVAKIMCRRTLHYLGRFDTVSEAEAAYQSKRKELFGEYA